MGVVCLSSLPPTLIGQPVQKFNPALTPPRHAACLANRTSTSTNARGCKATRFGTHSVWPGTPATRRAPSLNDAPLHWSRRSTGLHDVHEVRHERSDGTISWTHRRSGCRVVSDMGMSSACLTAPLSVLRPPHVSYSHGGHHDGAHHDGSRPLSIESASPVGGGNAVTEHSHGPAFRVSHHVADRRASTRPPDRARRISGLVCTLNPLIKSSRCPSG